MPIWCGTYVTLKIHYVINKVCNSKNISRLLVVVLILLLSAYPHFREYWRGKGAGKCHSPWIDNGESWDYASPTRNKGGRKQEVSVRAGYGEMLFDGEGKIDLSRSASKASRQDSTSRRWSIMDMAPFQLKIQAGVRLRRETRSGRKIDLMQVKSSLGISAVRPW